MLKIPSLRIEDSPDLAPESFNILIIKLSAVGDVIHTLPSLAALRHRFPEAHISWVVEEAASEDRKASCRERVCQYV
jgi:hypothetical protein